MNLALANEQRLLVESARAFLRSACPLSHVRAMEADPRGFSPEVWRRMADLGWPGLLLPASYGGSGQTFLEAALLLEELGRVLLPSPFLPTSVIAARVLLALGTEEQRSRWLPRIAAGELIATLALAEPGWRDEWGAVGLEARVEAGGLRLSGTKLFVPFARDADVMLVAARIGSERTSLLAVDGGTPGVEFTRLATLGGDHLYEVRFSDVRLEPSQAIGAGGAAAAVIEQAILQAGVGSLACLVGAAERVLEMTVDYAKTRVQFGRPIGSFQAVAHRCVEMRSDLDALRYLVYQAAWSLAAGRAADLEVGAAKAFGNEALRRFFMHAHQVHGAIGFSTEHDLHLFTRRAKAVELQWGSASFHRERVARAIGL